MEKGFASTGHVLDEIVGLLTHGLVDDATSLYCRCQEDIGYPLVNHVQGNRALQEGVANMLYHARDYPKAALVCENLGEFATDLDWRAALEVTPRRNAVTAEALRSVAQRVLVDGRRVVGWSLPKPGAEAASTQAAADDGDDDELDADGELDGDDLELGADA